MAQRLVDIVDHEDMEHETLQCSHGQELAMMQTVVLCAGYIETVDSLGGAVFGDQFCVQNAQHFGAPIELMTGAPSNAELATLGVPSLSYERPSTAAEKLDFVDLGAIS